MDVSNPTTERHDQSVTNGGQVIHSMASRNHLQILESCRFGCAKGVRPHKSCARWSRLVDNAACFPVRIERAHHGAKIGDQYLRPDGFAFDHASQCHCANALRKQRPGHLAVASHACTPVLLEVRQSVLRHRSDRWGRTGDFGGKRRQDAPVFRTQRMRRTEVGAHALFEVGT